MKAASWQLGRYMGKLRFCLCDIQLCDCADAALAFYDLQDPTVVRNGLPSKFPSVLIVSGIDIRPDQA